MIDLKLAAAVAAFMGAALLTVNWYFYSKGYHAAESKLMQEMADLRAANGIIIREQEQKYLAERDRISAEYQTTIEGLKAAHDKEIIDLNRLRDTVRVPECVPVSANKTRNKIRSITAMVQGSLDTITLRGYVGMLDPGDYHFLRLVVDGVLTKKSICHTNLTRYGNRMIRHIDIAAEYDELHDLELPVLYIHI